jgi:TatD DNase family protein
MNIFVVMFFDAHTHNPNAGRNSIIQFGDFMNSERFYSAGIHPWHVSNILVGIDHIRSLALHSNCAAIGETGLDKNVKNDFSLQVQSFEAHIALSEELEIPLILHCVKAWPEVLEIRKRLKPTQKWIFHGFSKHGIIEDVLKENILISFGKAILEEPLLAQALRIVPSEKLLLETDNSGMSIENIYQKAAEITAIELEELKDVIATNFKQTYIKWHIG